MAYFVVALVVGIAVGYHLITWRLKSKFFAHAEYWVYQPTESLPALADIMRKLVGTNPYGHRGRNPIGTAEAIIQSDVRFHMALVLRSKNSHVFRPDLFDRHTRVTAALLDSLASSKSLVKLRFVSDRPIEDGRHLQFLLHSCEAILDLAGGDLVYDSIARQFLTRQQLQTWFREKMDQSAADRHLDIVWEQGESGGHAETRGMVKVGLPELATAPVDTDQRLIAVEVMEAAARAMWKERKMPDPWQVHAFEDEFRVVPHQTMNCRLVVRVMRLRDE